MRQTLVPLFRKTAMAMLVSIGLSSSLMATENAEKITGETTLAVAQVGTADQSDARPAGYYRMKVGAYEVTALFDGTFEFHAELLRNLDQAEINHLLVQHYGAKMPIQSPVNGYLIHTGDHLVLIDTGAGKLFHQDGKPDAQGNLVEHIKASGYQPEQIDTIVLTHLHGDHTGGLIANGQAVFPNAKVYANKVDYEYWLSEQIAGQAPLERQIFFKMAMQSTRPYLNNGQWIPVESCSEIVPGITAVAAFGHTPGHTAFEITSDGEKMLVWGDVIHNDAVQFSHPEVAIENDSDREKAVSTRMNFLKKVVEENELVAGMHLPFPGIGHVRMDDNGKYQWIPVEESVTKE